MIDWAALYDVADRQHKAAAAVRFFAGLALSALGLLAAALIYAARHDVIVAGAAAAGGMVAGLVLSRRGRKVLLGLPLVIEGRVTAKPTAGEVVVIDVRVANVLHPEGERVADPERVGPRTVPARLPVLAALQVGDDVRLLCLSNGLAVRQVATDPDEIVESAR